MHRSRTGDAFQALEGFLLFRVNGTSRVGVSYRLLVVVVNMLFGILSGLRPLLTPGSGAALAQTMLVLLLQLSMAYVCFKWLPDADRIISRFAATQFLMEGLTTLALLAASAAQGQAAAAAGASAAAVNASLALGGGGEGALEEAAPSSSSSAEPTVQADPADVAMMLQQIGFALSLGAMGVPVLQLLEQRCVTPSIGVVQKRGGSPMALLAAAYMLAMSLPRQISALVARGEAGGMDAADAAGNASADAGDEAVVEGGGGGGGDTGGGGEGGGEGEKDEVEEEEEDEEGVQITQQAAGAAKLIARAAAAKEVAGKKLAPIGGESGQPASLGAMAIVGDSSSSMASVRAATRFRHMQRDNDNRKMEEAVDEEDNEDDDDDDDVDDVDID